MKRKPDTMVALVLIFCLGLVVSGFSTMSSGADDKRSVEVSAFR